MSEFGLKIKNIKAGTLFGYNQGVRDRYDYTDAMFSNSLFSDYIRANGLNVWKDTSTRDIICLDFDFGSRSYEEELIHLKKQFAGFEEDKKMSEESKQRIRDIFKKIEENKDNYAKYSKDEIRELFYENGVDVEYINKSGDKKETQIINYKMLYRNSSKAKIGQVMFINSRLYKKAYDWLTMGLGEKMPIDDAKIVEMSAYAPLTTSTIVGKFFCPVKDILILKDHDSFFKTMAKIVKAKEYTDYEKVVDEEATEAARQKAIREKKFLKDGVTPKYTKRYKLIEVKKKKCVVTDEETEVKNTLWDGEALAESSILPDWVNGMALLRNHFFKACAIRTNIQLFFKDWCEKNNVDYETYEVKDMFGISHRLKDIKMITTDNAIKWKKFMNLMGDTPVEAYQYWCDRVEADGCYWGIVKTDHPSKLGSGQQMSYQMINTLPSYNPDSAYPCCYVDEIRELAKESVGYVESMKKDNALYAKFLKKNATSVNHYEMLYDLYNWEETIGNSDWFRLEKRKIINTYVNRLNNGKIVIIGDNLTIFGNPYALLMAAVGENPETDPTLKPEPGTIQCYTTSFDDNEYLCGIRNPHNSPNNICYLHNHYSPELEKYFKLSKNIMFVNCVHTDIQDRANGCDFDSDFFFVTNNSVMVRSAKVAYEKYPTIVNKLKESGITYKNTMKEYARMDNKFAKSRIGIGESSNLAQSAMTYYWTNPTKELYDNFVILSVLAQVIIDGCKREYEVDALEEIKRIKKLKCMDKYIEIIDEDGKVKKQKKDFPEFMRYTRKISYTKNGKEIERDIINEQKAKLNNRIDSNLICPMNALIIVLKEIKPASQTNAIPIKEFIVHITGDANRRQMAKITAYAKELELLSKDNMSEDEVSLYITRYDEILVDLKKMKINNPKTMNRLIISGLNINTRGRKNDCQKYTRNLLNLLYRMNKDVFLSNFKRNLHEFEKKIA
ncbi:hypothetical protein DW846_02205 [Ruminococcus sp. AM36-2AA]|nr:hypothetical protein DW851_02200 [Ruminococcus sp. AM36-5]RGH62436.1 hypothetical protein DW846_02205 [Ruminococcus sp. AM36-2AA]